VLPATMTLERDDIGATSTRWAWATGGPPHARISAAAGGQPAGRQAA